MPFSSHECKSWIVEQIVGIAPRRILDVGPGAGVFADLLLPELPNLDMTGIEIWPPYVEQFDLRRKYTRILVGDFLSFEVQLEIMPRFDVVILGDVIEHFSQEDAYKVYALARKVGHHVVISTPIVSWPQGAAHGNPYEEHLYEFTYEELSTLPGVVSSTFEGSIGAILADGS